MQILPITLQYGIKYQPNKNIIKQQNIPSYNKITELSGYYYPVTFTGGKSTDLSLTKQQLDKLSAVYPPDIEESIEDTIKSGNIENKTLIDIHKDKYELLTICESLDEVKTYYPEFENVLSDSQVFYQEDSFIDKVKKGEIKGFDPDVDVALQILQLYWGHGFSLTTLRDEYAGINIDYTCRKLGIPKVDKYYGQYLKLSDLEYNERFTAEISRRAAEIERKRIEQKEGIYVPRGPLTDETKAKISESLRNYYANNPDKIYEMSERQTYFYENNPEEKEKFSQIMLRAWNYKEAESIKKKLAKFIGKPAISNEDIENSINPKSPMKNTFREFWTKNKWAKGVFSECVKKSIKRQDELSKLGLIYEPTLVKNLPEELKEEIAAYAKDEMPDIKTYLDYIFLDPRDSMRLYNINTHTQLLNENVTKAIKIGSRYFHDNADKSSIMADVQLLTILTMLEKIGNLYIKSDGHQCSNAKKLEQTTISKLNNASNNGTIKANDAAAIYNSFMFSCIDNNDKYTFNETNKTLNEIYSRIKKSYNKEHISQIYDNLLKKLNVLYSKIK